MAKKSRNKNHSISNHLFLWQHRYIHYDHQSRRLITHLHVHFRTVFNYCDTLTTSLCPFRLTLAPKQTTPCYFAYSHQLLSESSAEHHDHNNHPAIQTCPHEKCFSTTVYSIHIASTSQEPLPHCDHSYRQISEKTQENQPCQFVLVVMHTHTNHGLI